MHVYICRIIDVEALVQSTCVCTEVCVIICMSTHACQLCTLVLGDISVNIVIVINLLNRFS